MEDNYLPLEETLLPALLQCFGIMFLGFILGRFNILKSKEANGISVFVRCLALPALIFVQIATISFEDIKWEFIASIFISKVCIFVCVALMTILLSHPSDLRKSGIYAIATTQSNDFALAYPMFMSLYKDTHSEYPSYLYITAPVQLLILNTIGFVIIEMHRQNLNDTLNCYFIKVLKETLKNPIVFMTVIGLIWNVSFGHKILPIFDSGLKTLSAAFPATALLLVGHTMAVNSGKSSSHISFTVALLIITKNLIFPIILQKFSALLLRNSSDEEIQSFSSFGFLYGTTPTAPSVYVFATQYDTSVDIITKTIIGSTLLSAPIMFASASVISLTQKGIQNITFYLSLTISYISCASLLCCVWLFLSFIIGKKFLNISFGITLYIFFAQMLSAIGGVLLFFPISDFSNIFYAQYILSIGGIYATRICTLFLAILLLIIRWRSLCFILQARKHINVISIICLFIPFGIAALTLFAKNTNSDGPNCQLGYIQIIITFSITMICLLGTVVCLVLQHICFRKKYNKDVNDISYQTFEEVTQTSLQESIQDEKPICVIMPNEQISVDVEDLGNCVTDSQHIVPDDIENSLCDSHYNCSIEKRIHCASKLSTYHDTQKKFGLYDDRQIFQHTTILIVLSVAMTLSSTVCFWKLIMEETNGIFIELEFLDVIINYSLGILFFIIFGFNEGLIQAISNKWYKMRHGNNRIKREISTVEICHEFVTKYEEKLKSDIKNFQASNCNAYQRNDIYFCSSDLICWLTEHKAVNSIEQAKMYISCLLDGHIIQKVEKCEFFPRTSSVFKFTEL